MQTIEATWEEAIGTQPSRAIVLGASSPLTTTSSPPSTSFSVGATALIALTSAAAGFYAAWNLRDWLKGI